MTAWSNWELAYGTLRLLLNENDLPHPQVWGWGGGVTLGELVSRGLMQPLYALVQHTPQRRLHLRAFLR